MAIRDLLLRRGGLVSLPACPSSAPCPSQGTEEELRLQAIQVNLAGLGYALSHDLVRALAALSPAALADVQGWMHATLAASLGADVAHEPLFRRFPEDIPDDTLDLWFRKVLCHFLQEHDQPCLFCGAMGTTFVLDPCLHVVCGRCFDGSHWSACPVCEHHVDRSSPFFQPSLADRWSEPDEQVTFKRLHVTFDEEGEAVRLFRALCARTQALSPVDTDALKTLVQAWGPATLERLPAEIPVRENVAWIFGLLLAAGHDPAATLAAARPHLRTATDVLRLLAVTSGADPSLQATARIAQVRPGEDVQRRWHGVRANAVQAWVQAHQRPCGIAYTSSRFKVARLRRPLRRALLDVLASFPPDALMEDLLRHRADWIWVGRFLHPSEYADRTPSVARAFLVLRGSRPGRRKKLRGVWDSLPRQPGFRLDARGRPRYVSFAARFEELRRAGDAVALARHLGSRPGEMARRIDLLLRRAGPRAPEVVALLLPRLRAMATPTLLAVAASLPLRATPWPARVFFPKGRFFEAPSTPDRRDPVPGEVGRALVAQVERELLARFARRSPVEDAVLDRSLASVPVPFNERTASRSAVHLPRGSFLDLPPGRFLRLFLHWCQPATGGSATDIDLSVAFYDGDWKHVGVCSYYQLTCSRGDRVVATSSGDLRDAPWPDGASEFVDLDVAAAVAAGWRYAVMVVTNYAGMPFSALERGFAGVMLRSDRGCATFDPRTVALRFALDGANGVFTPLAVDLEGRQLFWLDACTRGLPAFNNVATATRTLERMCRDTMACFRHGVRPSLFHLGALHAAARAGRAWVRTGDGFQRFVRRSDESTWDLYRRIVDGTPDAVQAALPAVEPPVLAVLLHGDLALPEGSEAWALFREALTGTVAASDLLAHPAEAPTDPHRGT